MNLYEVKLAVREVNAYIVASSFEAARALVRKALDGDVIWVRIITNELVYDDIKPGMTAPGFAGMSILEKWAEFNSAVCKNRPKAKRMMNAIQRSINSEGLRLSGKTPMDISEFLSRPGNHRYIRDIGKGMAVDYCSMMGEEWARELAAQIFLIPEGGSDETNGGIIQA